MNEQKEEDIAAVVDEQQKKKKLPEITVKQHKIIIMVMAAVAILLAAVSELVADYIGNLYEVGGVVKNYWPVLVWAIPIICLLETFLVRFYFKNRIAGLILFSGFFWGVIGGAIFHCAYWNNQNVWYVIFIGLPMQVIAFLVYLWKGKQEKK
mgnify:FL=1